MIDTPAILAIVGSSLLGSLHCAGMCGPLAVAACGSTAARPVPIRVNGRALSRPGLWRNVMLYHAGRLAGYLALGATAGALGSGVNLAGRLAGVQHVAMYAAACVVILMGVAMLAAGLGLRAPGLLSPRWSPFTRLWRAVHRWKPASRAGAIGLLTSALPCGWLWIFVVAAAGEGGVAAGALTMLAFWVGTVPILTIIGGGLGRALLPLRSRIPIITGVAIIALGGLMLATHAARHAHKPQATTLCNAP